MTNLSHAECVPVGGVRVYRPGTKDPRTSVSTWARRTLQRAKTRMTNKPADADVPCGNCNACCRCGYEIDRRPGDNPSLRWVAAKDGPEILARNPDKSCVYAQGDGCAVYDQRPAACKEYDCRGLAIVGLASSKFPILNSALMEWDMSKTIKSRDDRIALGALRLSIIPIVTHATIEESVGVALATYKNYLGMAQEAERFYRDHPDKLAKAMDYIQSMEAQP